MADWVEVSALIFGPVAAVGLTLWRERARQERERKLNIMRTLLISRIDLTDAGFTHAVNLVPIEFGHVDAVMTAWEEFTRAANAKSLTGKETEALLRAMMLDLGYSDRAASQVAQSPYLAAGLDDQRSFVRSVLGAIVRIAAAAEMSAAASETLVKRTGPDNE